MYLDYVYTQSRYYAHSSIKRRNMPHTNFTRSHWHYSAKENHDHLAMTDKPIIRFLSLSLKTKFSHQKTSPVLSKYYKNRAKGISSPSVQFSNRMRKKAKMFWISFIYSICNLVEKAQHENEMNTPTLHGWMVWLQHTFLFLSWMPNKTVNFLQQMVRWDWHTDVHNLEKNVLEMA